MLSNPNEAMLLAATEAVLAQGISTPNPPVGAVIFDNAGNFLSSGHTSIIGGPHAERIALERAGDRVRGGTTVVTLEPCNHFGRTGPCAAALVDAGIAEVIYAVADPHPKASGGADYLRSRGVRVTAGVEEDFIASTSLRSWLFRQKMGRPEITVKIASTIDGRICAPDGSSQWITGELARRHVHETRSRVDAIVVGTGTVLKDNPTLTARTENGALFPGQPHRIILGLREIPSESNVFTRHSQTTIVRSRNPIEVLEAVPDSLSVLIEGGPTIIGSFLDAELVDRIELYLAPTVLGDGQSSVQLPSVAALTDAKGFVRESIQELGADVLLTFTR